MGRNDGRRVRRGGHYKFSSCDASFVVFTTHSKSYSQRTLWADNLVNLEIKTELSLSLFISLFFSYEIAACCPFFSSSWFFSDYDNRWLYSCRSELRAVGLSNLPSYLRKLNTRQFSLAGRGSSLAARTGHFFMTADLDSPASVKCGVSLSLFPFKNYFLSRLLEHLPKTKKSPTEICHRQRLEKEERLTNRPKSFVVT